MLNPQQKKKLQSKSWRMKNMYKIRNRDNELVTFTMNRAQKHFNENKHTRNIILKSRQLGFTTYETIDSFDDCLSQKNFNMLLISFDKDSAVDIFDEKARLAWDNITPGLKDLWDLEIARANTMKFKLGKGIFSSFKVRTKGRSGTFSRLHVSEYGKICKESPKKAKEIITGTIPAVPINGRVDIESTAEGEEGKFHDIFWESFLAGEPQTELDFKAHFYNWTWDDTEIAKIKYNIPIEEMEHSERFEKYQILHSLTDKEITYYYSKWKSVGRDWKALHQEYPTTPEEAFVSSGDKLFDADIIAKMVQEAKGITGTKENNWIIFEDYIPGHRYAIGADVAEGLGQDSSTIVVIDFTPLKPKVVAIYMDNKIEPDVFAYEIKAGGLRYGSALAAVENNNMGRSTLDVLKTIYNEDLIFTMKMADKKGEERDTMKLGWNTNAATKPLMFFDLNTAVNQELFEVHSKHLLHEMRVYTKDKLRKTKTDEDATNHFDLLTALAICWQMRDYAIDTKDYNSYTAGGVNPLDTDLGI